MNTAIALKPPPGPRGVPILGSILDVWRDPLGFFVRGARDHGDVVQFRFGHYRYVLLNDAEATRHVLIDNAKSYQKSRNYDGLRLVLGNGLVTSEGDFWRRQRKLAQPGFHKQRLKGFADTMAECTEEMLAGWDSSNSGALDLHAEMMALTLRIVGKTLFSTDLAGDAAAVGDAISIGIKHANDYAESVIRMPPWLPTPNNLRFKQAVRVLDGMVLRIIEERRKSGTDGDDLLGMLMSARDDDGKGMTDQQLRDEVMTLVVAGHETTANALAWTFDLLSRHPDADRSVHAEASAIDGRIGIDELPRLSYTLRVVQESMRLYPPVWVFEREAIADDVIAGYAIPKGTVVAVSPWSLHRNPRYWENPEGFDPERFLPTAVEARPRCAYLPFATGPRQCIGNAFAMMELQIVLATVARRFRLSLVPGATSVVDPKVTLRPRDGMRMTRARRHA